MAAGDVEANRSSVNFKSGYRFDGVDDKIDFGNPFAAAPDAMSIAFWAKVKNWDSTHSFFFRVLGEGSARGPRMQYRTDNNTFKINIRADGATHTITVENVNTTYTPNRWYHFIVTINPTEAILYIDGVNTASVTMNASVLNYSTQDMWIGQDNNLGYELTGEMSDFRLYNKVLTATQITELAGGRHVSENLVNHWKLDGDATDSVGSANGTVTGALAGTFDGGVAQDITADRTTANDQYIIAPLSKQNMAVMTAIVEEA